MKDKHQICKSQFSKCNSKVLLKPQYRTFPTTMTYATRYNNWMELSINNLKDIMKSFTINVEPLLHKDNISSRGKRIKNNQINLRIGGRRGRFKKTVKIKFNKY